MDNFTSTVEAAAAYERMHGEIEAAERPTPDEYIDWPRPSQRPVPVSAADFIPLGYVPRDTPDLPF